MKEEPKKALEPTLIFDVMYSLVCTSACSNTHLTPIPCASYSTHHNRVQENRLAASAGAFAFGKAAGYFVGGESTL